MGLRLLIFLVLLFIAPCLKAYMAPQWPGLAWQFDLGVTRSQNHGVDHFIATAETIANAGYKGVGIFGNGYGWSVWDISLTLKVDGSTQLERRFAAPGDGNWHWSNQYKYAQQGIWRNAIYPDEYRYYGYNTNDTLLNLFIDGGWSFATGGEPVLAATTSAFIWQPGMSVPMSNVTYEQLQTYGWAGRVSYGLDPQDRSRWGIPMRAQYWVKAWMPYPQFLEDWWYHPYYWNRDGHGSYVGGNPYEGVSVYFAAGAEGATEIVIPSGKLEIIKSTQHKDLQIGIRARAMGSHDKWEIFRRDFPNANALPPDAPSTGYAHASSQTFFTQKNLGTKILGGTRESQSEWIPTEFTSVAGGATRYYLVMHGNSDWGWYRIVDTVEIRPYAINTHAFLTSPDATYSWSHLPSGDLVPIARTRIDQGFQCTLSVIETSLDGPDLGDQHVALRAVRSSGFHTSWETAWWLHATGQVLQTGPYREDPWESSPTPPQATGFQQGVHTLHFQPHHLEGTIGMKGRFFLNAWRQHVRTTDPDYPDAQSGTDLPNADQSPLLIDVYPFATALITIEQTGQTLRSDTFDKGIQIDLGSLPHPLQTIKVKPVDTYPIGGLYLLLTRPDGKSVCLTHNFDHPQTPMGTDNLSEHLDEPGDYLLQLMEFNPFDSASLSDFAPSLTLPTGAGQDASGYFAPYGMAMGWRKIGAYHFEIPNDVEIQGMLIQGGLEK